jgi:hypothetical protein
MDCSMGWSLWHAAGTLQSQDGEFSTLFPLHFACELLKRGEMHWQSAPYVPCVCLASQATSGARSAGVTAVNIEMCTTLFAPILCRRPNCRTSRGFPAGMLHFTPFAHYSMERLPLAWVSPPVPADVLWCPYQQHRRQHGTSHCWRV